MGVDGEGRAGGIADALVADAEVEDGVFDVKLDGGDLAFERNDGMRGGEWVDAGLEEVVAGVAIQIAIGLGEGDELGSATVGVEGEGAVLFGEAEVFGDLGGEGGALGLFFKELGVDGGRLRRLFGSTGPGWACCFSQRWVASRSMSDEGNLLFCASAFSADVAHDGADDAVAHDDLIAAVLEIEADAMGVVASGWIAVVCCWAAWPTELPQLIQWRARQLRRTCGGCCSGRCGSTWS